MCSFQYTLSFIKVLYYSDWWVLYVYISGPLGLYGTLSLRGFGTDTRTVLNLHWTYTDTVLLLSEWLIDKMLNNEWVLFHYFIYSIPSQEFLKRTKFENTGQIQEN